MCADESPSGPRNNIYSLFILVFINVRRSQNEVRFINIHDDIRLSCASLITQFTFLPSVQQCSLGGSPLMHSNLHKSWRRVCFCSRRCVSASSQRDSCGWSKGGRRMWASTFHPCHVATRLCLREPEWIWIGCNTVQNIYCSRVRFMENWAFMDVDGGGVKAKDSHHLLFTRNGRVSYSFSFPSVPPAIEMGFLRITNAFQGRIKYQTPVHVIWPSVTNHHHHHHRK